MTASAFAEDILGREPALRLARIFAHDGRALNAFAFAHELLHSAFGLSGLRVAAAKLEYWCNETELALHGSAQHPLLGALERAEVEHYRHAARAVTALLDAELCSDAEQLRAGFAPAVDALSGLLCVGADVAKPLVALWMAALQLRYSNRADRYTLPGYTRADLAGSQLRTSQQGTPAFLPLLVTQAQRLMQQIDLSLEKAGGSVPLRLALWGLRHELAQQTQFIGPPERLKLPWYSAFAAWRHARRAE
jgi:hypothetical protein